MKIIIPIILLILCVAGIAIKILLKKNGEFAGTCSSNNPFLKKKNLVNSVEQNQMRNVKKNNYFPIKPSVLNSIISFDKESK